VRQPEQPGQQQGATAQDQRDTAALKQLLLSLNFTSARAAALMDAAGPSTPQQLQDMMRQYQALYCRWEPAEPQCMVLSRSSCMIACPCTAAALCRAWQT
jgi:hypothetical protein